MLYPEVWFEYMPKEFLLPLNENREQLPVHDLPYCILNLP